MLAGLIAVAVAVAGTLDRAEWVQVVTGSDHACALDSDGFVVCWGEGAEDSLDASFVQLSAGLDHTCGLDGRGRVHCWGTELPAWPDHPITHLASGDRHACGLYYEEVEQDGLRVVNTRDDNAFCVGARAPEGSFTDLVVEGPRTCFVGTQRVCVGPDLAERRPTCRIAAPDRIECRGNRDLRRGAVDRVPPTPEPGHPRHPVTGAVEMVENWEGRARWGALTEQEIRGQRDRALALIRDLAELDDPDPALVFRLNAVTGRLVESSDEPRGPGFADVDGTVVNQPWYVAASALREDPALATWLVDTETSAAVQYYRDRIDSGALPAIRGE